MGDYDSCTEKYFRICSRAPIPDMHIAREPGIQLLRLQAAIAGLRTYFCARGASVCERLCQGTCGIEKPMTLSEHPTCTVVMQGRGILSTAESICKCRLDSGRGKNSSRHFLRPYIRGNRCFGKSLSFPLSHLLRPQLLLRANAYSVPSRWCTYIGQYHAVKPTVQMPKRWSAFLLGPRHKGQGDRSQRCERPTDKDRTYAKKKLCHQKWG